MVSEDSAVVSKQVRPEVTSGPYHFRDPIVTFVVLKRSAGIRYRLHCSITAFVPGRHQDPL